MTIFQHGILLIFLSTSLALQSMVSYHLLETPDQKKVLVFGDHHSLRDHQVRQFLPSFIQKAMGREIKRPIAFIVEHPGIEHADQVLQAESIHLLLKVDRAQSTHGAQFFSLRFFDARGEVSECFEGLSKDMADYVVRGIPASYLLKRYRKEEFQGEVEEFDETAWNHIAKAIENDTIAIKDALTTKDFLAHLEESLQKLTALLVKYADNAEVVRLLTAHISKYKKAQVEFAQLLKAPDMGVAYTKQFLNKTLEERLELVEQFEERTESTDYAFAECSFFDKVMDTLKTEPCVCLLVGDAHPKNIVELLIASGSTLLAQDTIVDYKYPLLEKFRFQSDNASDGFLRRLLEENLPQFLESANTKSCWSCNAKPEKLLQCSRCKKAQYCTAACQKSDWTSHKKYCKSARDLQQYI